MSDGTRNISGREISLGDDKKRKVWVGVAEDGAIVCQFMNEDRKTVVSLSPEAAEALVYLLAGVGALQKVEL